MNKKTLLTLAVGFVAGVSLTWGYFNITTATSLKLAATKIEHQTPHIEQPQQNAKLNISKQGAVANNVVSVEEIDNSNLNAVAALSDNGLPLEEQVVALKKQLSEQKATLNRVLKQMRPPFDAETALQDRFDKQTRNDEWAYNTETALQDFLLTADLTAIPRVVSAQCKTSVCKFELVAPADNEAFDHTHWRELNDKLMQQDFWRQFKTTSSTSSDSQFTLLTSTEL